LKSKFRKFKKALAKKVPSQWSKWAVIVAVTFLCVVVVSVAWTTVLAKQVHYPKHYRVPVWLFYLRGFLVCGAFFLWGIRKSLIEHESKMWFHAQLRMISKTKVPDVGDTFAHDAYQVLLWQYENKLSARYLNFSTQRNDLLMPRRRLDGEFERDQIAAEKLAVKMSRILKRIADLHKIKKRYHFY
jgi:hypothetical protein